MTDADIVTALADVSPDGADTPLGDIFCYFCGAYELTDGEHDPTCLWRAAREARGLSVPKVGKYAIAVERCGGR